jgi:tRNA modification GTPase
VRSDTIVALITGVLPSPVAWLRLSGPDAYEVARNVFHPWPEFPKSQQAVYGGYAHGDDGIALPFPEGHSYTGEETVELSLHGSPFSVRTLLDACMSAGARQASPGEFTMRAFMNGRLDLTEAEAVAETIEAETERELKEALRVRGGALSLAVSGIRSELLDVLAAIEASVDFSEEIGEVDHIKIADSSAQIANRIATLLIRGRRAYLARRGLRVAIVGQPNSGKSSLLNALLGFNRAIVSPSPGTTRDTIEESVQINGVRIILTDTAGLREGQDEVEKLGVERTADAAKHADLLIYVYDAARGWTSTDDDLLSRLEGPVILVGNKCDIASAAVGIAASAKEGTGVELVSAALTSDLNYELTDPAVNDRQQALLQLAQSSVNECSEAASAELPPDLLSTLLNEAILQLGRITGETATPDMLDEIFSRFCIGK